MRQKKAEEFQAKRRDEMIESIRIIALAVEEGQVEHSEACLRLKGLLDYVAPELLDQTPYRVFQEVHDKIQHMPTHRARKATDRSEEHTSELQSRPHLVCRLLLEKKKKQHTLIT